MRRMDRECACAGYLAITIQFSWIAGNSFSKFAICFLKGAKVSSKTANNNKSIGNSFLPSRWRPKNSEALDCHWPLLLWSKHLTWSDQHWALCTLKWSGGCLSTVTTNPLLIKSRVYPSQAPFCTSKVERTFMNTWKPPCDLFLIFSTQDQII